MLPTSRAIAACGSHFHYAHASDFNRALLGVHGDYECLGGDGVYCLLAEYPPGSAWELVPQLGLWLEVNDVRLASSPPLQWYALAGIRIHEPSAMRSARHRAPRPLRWASNVILAGNLPIGPRGTNMWDSEREGVSWSTGTIPFVSYVVDSFFHAHPEMVDDLWLLDGSPGQLGLLRPPWIDAYWAAKTGPGVIRALKAHLHRRINASGAELICRYEQRAHVERAPSGAYVASRFTRRAPCLFTRGVRGKALRWTLVGFFRAQVGGLPKAYGMHAILRIVYHTDSPDYDYTDIFSASCARHRITLAELNADVAHPSAIDPPECIWTETLGEGLIKGDAWLIARDVLYPLGMKWWWKAPALNSAKLCLLLAALICCAWCCVVVCRHACRGVLGSSAKQSRPGVLLL